MKTFGILFCLVALMSCKERTTDIAEKQMSTTAVVASEVKKSPIPIYNFSELEPLLNIQNDTTYVINFWATWCKPCVKELPYFEKVTETYSKEKVKVILVSLDFPEQLEKRVIPFLEEHKLKSEVLLLDDADANSWIPKVDSTWSGAIPATVIYKNKNKKFVEGSMSYSDLETYLKTIL